MSDEPGGKKETVNYLLDGFAIGGGLLGCPAPHVPAERPPLNSHTSSVASCMMNYQLISWLCGIWFLLGSFPTALAKGPKTENKVATLLVKLIDPEGKAVEGTQVGHGILREQSQPEGNEIKDTDWILHGSAKAGARKGTGAFYKCACPLPPPRPQRFETVKR